MTFAEYNTDTNFDNDKSSLEELVKLGISEGKNSDEIKTSLSPKWQKSKKIGEFDDYFKKYSQTAPKVEEVTEKETIEPIKEEKQTSTSYLSGKEKAYNDAQNKRAEQAKQEMLDDIKKDSARNWEEMYNSSLKRADAYKNIDDHYLESLPTFIFRRYQNDEFGDTSTPEGKKDAKLRLAYFMINGVGTALQNASAVIKGGQMQESDYEKYKNANMTEGLANHWNKNKADTEGAIKAVEKLYENEQDARLAAEQFTRDRKANTKWNMMDQNQKTYALEVTKEIGDMLGGMDTSELANFIAGSALTGDMSKDELIAVGLAKLAANSPQILANLPEGSIKDTVMSMIGGNGVPVTAGIGGVGGKTDSNGNQTNLTGNLQNYETINGDKVSFDFTDSKAKEKITAITDDLKDKYANGEIDAETFKKYYDPIYSEMIKHPSAWGSTPKSNKVLNQIKYDKLNDISSSFEELNSKADSGAISTSDYDEQFDDILANARKWGADEKMISTIQKKKKSREYILKKAESAAKKKKN